MAIETFRTSVSPVPPADPGSYISNRLAWMELQAEGSGGEDRKKLLSAIASEWKRRDELTDGLDVLEHFLDAFLTPGARIQRGVADAGKRLMELTQVAHEPLTMTLGTPDAPIPEFWRSGPWPPTQRDFDKRLAEWLRAVILSKNFKTLHRLAEALEMIPVECLRVGIDYHEFMRKLNLPLLGDSAEAGKPPLTRYFAAFFDILETEHRLPGKAELDQRADVIDPKACKEYRKKLGFQNLPRTPRRH